MPTTTPNLNLQKFDSTDSTSTGGQFIDAMASNMDIIDQFVADTVQSSESVKQTAQQASATATKAEQTASQAQQEAQTASQAANQAQTSAGSAVEKATGAESTAQAASQTASAAESKAQQALDTANRAEQTAKSISNTVITATLTVAGWQESSGAFTQTVSNENFAVNQKYNISMDNNTINQMLADGVMAMRADNIDGSCVVNVLGAKPSGKISIQIEIVNVTSK